MMRADLLAMSHDDIVALSNRGTLKRILKELKKDDLSWEITADDEALVIEWSDEVTCTIAADDSLATAHCTCQSVADTCRHLLRSVLAYQKSCEEADDKPKPWDPGAWSDELLAEHFPGGERRQARRKWNAGLVIELVRGVRPSAHFHKLRHLVRFVIYGDPAGAVCNCGQSAPCGHVLLAAWGFRRLPEGEEAGIVSVGDAGAPLAKELVADSRSALSDFVVHGVSGCPPSLLNRLNGLRERLESEGAIWLANITADLVEHCVNYGERNARFSSREVTELLGEFILRLEAATLDDPPLPRYFLTGHKRAAKSSFGRTFLVGLGSTARMRGAEAELLAFAEDTDTGQLVAISRQFKPSDDGTLPDFDELGGRSYGRMPDLRTLARSRMVIERARMRSDHRLQIGRSAVGIYPQDFQWEGLSLFQEDFSELNKRLAAIPPGALRPRRLGADFFVCPICAVDNARFCPRTQSVRAVLRGPGGKTARLFHPFIRFNAAGTEVLLDYLQDQSATPRFITGRVRRQDTTMVIEPAALVFELESKSVLVQPWLDPHPEGNIRTQSPERSSFGAVEEGQDLSVGPVEPDALQETVKAHIEALAEVALLGFDQAKVRSPATLEQLLRRCQALQLQTFEDGTTALSESLQLGGTTRDFTQAFFDNLKLARLAQEL